MKISPARKAAFDVLLKIETEKAFSSILLPAHERALNDPDRSLCHELTLGVLRRQIYLDKLIQKHARDRKLDTAVRIAIRLGIYQLLYLNRVPAYSAINESVELVARARKTSAKGFVNAVLRNVSRGNTELDFSDELDRISVETSHPRWLIGRWVSEFGLAETVLLAEANNRPSELAFRITNKGASAGIEASPDWGVSVSVPGCFKVKRAMPNIVALAESGQIYFQDEASQLVASAVRLDADDRFLDVCAAPGSKTTAIANVTSPSALIIAGDLYRQRVENMKEIVRRQGVGWINIVQYDAEKPLPFSESKFDAVLVDAPCSGTGTIRHNPEIRYFLRPDDFAKFNSKQLQILRNASKMVKPGGQLIYSTCSLEADENEAVCRQFANSTKDFLSVAPAIPSEYLTDSGFARTFPHRHAMDGFFIAQFNRATFG